MMDHSVSGKMNIYLALIGMGETQKVLRTVFHHHCLPHVATFLDLKNYGPLKRARRVLRSPQYLCAVMVGGC